MERLGAMPRRAWVEVRDAEGALRVAISARIEGGAISADLPAFAPNTLGTIQLRRDEGASIYREPANLRALPTNESFIIVQMG